MHAITREPESGILRLDLPEVVVFGQTIVELRQGIEAQCLWCADADDACGMCSRIANEAGD